MPHLPGRLQDLASRWQEQRVFDLAERHSQQVGVALLLSEFGATDDLHAVERAADLADRNMVSWQYWAYFNRDPCCERPEEGLVHDLSRPPATPNVKEEKLDVLARPYPRAIAGTPRRFGFDRNSGAFELAYSTRPPDATSEAGGLETEVLLPERHYKNGFVVGASGAEVVSRPNERILRLVARPEESLVAVRVEPA
jgi:endoglycosylceramidase